MNFSCSIEKSELSGHSKFSNGTSTAHCTVMGPLECPLRFEKTNELHIEIKYHTSDDKFYASLIKHIISKFIIKEIHFLQAITINIYITGENSLLCAINACFLALIRAGIPLNSIFYACSSFLVKDEVFICDKEKIVYRHGMGDLRGCEEKALICGKSVWKVMVDCVEDVMDPEMF